MESQEKNKDIHWFDALKIHKQAEQNRNFIKAVDESIKNIYKKFLIND